MIFLPAAVEHLQENWQPLVASVTVPAQYLHAVDLGNLASYFRMRAHIQQASHQLIRRTGAASSRQGPCKASSKAMPSVGTHSGTFHCDEALGCFLLQQTPQYKDAAVTRSRDPAVLDKLDIVIDVGGTYEPGMLSTLGRLVASPGFSTCLCLTWLTPSTLQSSSGMTTISVALPRHLGMVRSQMLGAEASHC